MQPESYHSNRFLASNGKRTEAHVCSWHCWSREPLFPRPGMEEVIRYA